MEIESLDSYPLRTFDISIKGISQHVGEISRDMWVIRKNMEMEKIYVDEYAWTGECITVMFYNLVVYMEVPYKLGIKNRWKENRIIHYALLEGFNEPKEWEDREKHPNYIARDKGFEFGSGLKWGCINGRPIDWFRWTDNINENEIHMYENGKKITKNEMAGCYKCADNMRIHMEETKTRALGQINGEIVHYEELIKKVEQELDIYEKHKSYLEKKKEELSGLSLENVWDEYPTCRM